MVQVDIVDRQSGTPYFSAARAAASSPRRDSSPARPVGARMSGDAHRCPNRVIDWSRVETSVNVRVRNRHLDRKSTRLNSSHTVISYAVFCLKKKKKNKQVIIHY